MKVKIKRGLAILLALLLINPANAVIASATESAASTDISAEVNADSSSADSSAVSLTTSTEETDDTAKSSEAASASTEEEKVAEETTSTEETGDTEKSSEAAALVSTEEEKVAEEATPTEETTGAEKTSEAASTASSEEEKVEEATSTEETADTAKSSEAASAASSEEEKVEEATPTEEATDAEKTSEAASTASSQEEAVVEENSSVSGETSADAATTETSTGNAADDKVVDQQAHKTSAPLLGFNSLEFNTDDEETPEFDAVYYNTGSIEYEVLPAEAKEYDESAKTFDDNGEYTIEIEEDNPFFPYEVQFRVGDNTWTEWFKTPDSKVEVEGHTFGVSVRDGKYSSVTLHIAGDDIVVYPEEKTFTNNGKVLNASMSYQPLKVVDFSNVDLSAYSPAQLTKVSTTAIFNGANESDKVVWTSTSAYASESSDYEYIHSDDDSYTITDIGAAIDLSVSTCYGGEEWEMIVGDADQLTQSNTRYIGRITTKDSSHWLVSSVKRQKKNGKTDVLDLTDSGSYYDYNRDDKHLNIYAAATSTDESDKFFVNLSLGSDFSTSDQISVYDEKGKDITSQIWGDGAGYEIKRSEYVPVTIVTRDASGNETGRLPLKIRFSFSSGDTVNESGGYVEYYSLRNESGFNIVDDDNNHIYTLYKNYPANGEYYLKLRYEYKAAGINTYYDTHNEMVKAAYDGKYDSMESAAGAKDIKEQLLPTSSDVKGYKADFSVGHTFTIFTDDNGSIKRYEFSITTVGGNRDKSRLNSATAVTFEGLVDSEGNAISCYVVDAEMDSYGDYSYRTIIVSDNVNLTKVAPTFYTSSGVSLYRTGSSEKIESGKDFRDFSNGKAQQYTAASEDGSFQENYWLQVVKPENTPKHKLYINSFGDDEANVTVDENGVTRAAREVILDSRTGRKHDILVINMSNTALKSVKASLDSETLKIDDYWTLSGKNDLSAFVGTKTEEKYDELPNLAKVRIAAKEDVEDGTDVSGTLTITSEGAAIAVITLTGTVGNPQITTKKIPDAVKFVHYGTMIQNNNKYKWNRTSYTLIGTLPAGMELHENGELYGVPMETGEFKFSIRMDNSNEYFSSSTREYTLKVLPNTDANVDNSTSENYDVLEKIPDFASTPSKDATFVSKGLYSEFVKKYSVVLDGKLLTPDEDYTSESGSTRITIKAQTLAQGKGTHTISVEFRDGADNFNRAAQNYHIESSADEPDDDDDSGKKPTDSDSGKKPTDSDSGKKNPTDRGSENSSSGNGSSGNDSSSGSGNGSSDSDSSSASTESISPSAGRNAVTFRSMTGKMTGVRGETPVLSANIQEAVQGPQAQVAFQIGTPEGFTQLMTFNLVVNSGVNSDAKSGRLVLNIRKDLQKAGRVFALVGIDKNGQPHLFNDLDGDDATITVDISIEGYAFTLIYSDGVNAATTLKTTGSVYVVQSGDTLSRIAQRLRTTVSDLAVKNNIKDVNKIFPNQEIRY